MDAETDNYIIATFALWAGDFKFCETLLKKIAPVKQYRKIPDSVEGPEQFIKYIAALRQRQLSQKKGEFEKLISHYRSKDIDLVSSSTVIETNHLRGVIWRLDDRHFRLLAYLQDLSWENGLFEKSIQLLIKVREKKISGLFIDTRHKPPTDSHYIRSWGLLGNPFITVHQSEIGLIEATAIWIEEELPKDFNHIQEKLEAVLKYLDEEN